MSEESIIAESYSNLKSAILLGRTDIVRGILSTAAESKFHRSGDPARSMFIDHTCSFSAHQHTYFDLEVFHLYCVCVVYLYIILCQLQELVLRL